MIKNAGFLIETPDGGHQQVMFGKPDMKLKAKGVKGGPGRITKDWAEDQPRDEHGMWTAGGGGMGQHFSGPTKTASGGTSFKHNLSGAIVEKQRTKWRSNTPSEYGKTSGGGLHNTLEEAMRQTHESFLGNSSESHPVPPDLQNRREIQTGGGSIIKETKPGVCNLMLGGLEHNLAHGSFSVVTAANPMGNPLSLEENTARNEKLRADLKAAGAISHKVWGVYTNDAGITSSEPSFMVHHTAGITPAFIDHLAHKYNQESDLHYTLGRTTIRYTDGPKKGQDMLKLEHYTLKPAKGTPQTYVPGAGSFAMDGSDRIVKPARGMTIRKKP